MQDAKSIQLKRAAEWKVFETQALLLSDDVTSLHMDMAKKWIQPVHYSEMIEERTSHHKCGLPTCRHVLGKRSPSSYRDIIDASSVVKATAENTIGGAVNVASNYCSDVCYRSSTRFYGSLDESAPVTRKHATHLLLSPSPCKNPSDNNTSIDSILDTLSVGEADSSRSRVAPSASPPSHSQSSHLQGGLSAASYTSPDKQRQTAGALPILNISRFGPDGSPIKRVTKPKQPNQFTSSPGSGKEEETLADKSAYEKATSAQQASNSPAPPVCDKASVEKTTEKPVDRPITYIKSVKIPANPVPKQTTGQQLEARARPLSPQSPTNRAVSLQSLPKPLPAPRSPVPHTDEIADTSSSEAGGDDSSPKKQGGAAAWLVLPASFQQLWDAPSPSPAKDSVNARAASLLRAASSLHSLTTPSLLCYDPVTSALPPSHTPLASARRSEEISGEQGSIHAEDERQRQIRLLLREDDQVVHHGGRKSNKEVEKGQEKQFGSSAVSKQKEERERALKMSRMSTHSGDKSSVGEPSVVKDTQGTTTSSSSLKPSRKSDPETVRGILKVARSEAPGETMDLVPLLEHRLAATQLSDKPTDRAATRLQLLDSNRNEFGIYDRHSSDEEGGEGGEFDLDSDEEAARDARKRGKKKSQHADGDAGRPKLKLKQKSAAIAPDESSGKKGKKSISFGEDSTRVFDREATVAASSHSIAERSVLNTKTFAASPSPSPSPSSSGEVTNLHLEGGVGRTRGGHPILPPSSAARVVMVDPSQFKGVGVALQASPEKAAPRAQAKKGYNSRDGFVSEEGEGVSMKHALDVPSVSELEQMLTNEQVAALLEGGDEDEAEGGFEDDLYGGDAGRRAGAGSAVARGKTAASDLSGLAPHERDAYLIEKQRAEEEKLYGPDSDSSQGEAGEQLREVQRPLFSEQLGEWLEGCDWGGAVREGPETRGPSSSKLNKAYPSCYTALMKKNTRPTKVSGEQAESNTLDWDSQLADIARQEVERTELAQAAAFVKTQEEEHASAEASAASASQRAERARAREALKSDPDNLAKEKERRDQRSKLKRELKILPLPPHVSPSMALQHTARVRQEQEMASKVRPSPPPQRPVPVPVPRAVASASGSNSYAAGRPPNWHPPPPPTAKHAVGGVGSRRNPVEKKRTVANERIMKMEIVEKTTSDLPEPLVKSRAAGGNGSAVGEIEGYRPLYGPPHQTSVAAETLGGKEESKEQEQERKVVGVMGEEEEEEEEEDVAYVLTDRDVDDENVLVLSPEEDVMSAGEELTEDEKIWKEIFGADAKLPGSDDQDDEDAITDVKSEMNSILARNYFLYLWTTMEDLFGGDVITWMSGGKLPEADPAYVAPPIDEPNNYMDPNEHRQVLSTSSQSVAHSLATLLTRAVQHAEKSIGLTHLFASEHSNTESQPLFTSSESREYHHAKQTLLGRAEIRRANPAFNSMQWNFLGLLLVDALVTRKILGLKGRSTPSSSPRLRDSDGARKQEVSDDDRAGAWEAHFTRAVVGVVGGRPALEGLLDARELHNLRCFFDVDT